MTRKFPRRRKSKQAYTKNERDTDEKQVASGWKERKSATRCERAEARFWGRGPGRFWGRGEEPVSKKKRRGRLKRLNEGIDSLGPLDWNLNVAVRKGS